MTTLEQIDAYLDTLLSGITIANGWLTDAGRAVFREQEYTERPDDQSRLVVFRDELQSGFEGDVPASLGEENHFCQYRVVGDILDDKGGTQGRNLVIDLHRALRQNPTFGELIEQVQNLKIVTEVCMGDEVYSFVQASFTVFYVTARGEM